MLGINELIRYDGVSGTYVAVFQVSPSLGHDELIGILEVHGRV